MKLFFVCEECFKFLLFIVLYDMNDPFALYETSERLIMKCGDLGVLTGRYKLSVKNKVIGWS